jgi:phosphohistidine swiveling domain-containing protein
MGVDRMSGKLYVARSSQIAARKLDGEMMIMSAVDSTLFTLNKTATVVWEAADGSTSLDEIVASRICGQFDVAHGEALQDAGELVRQLAAHGILLVSEEPIPAQGLAKKAGA